MTSQKEACLVLLVALLLSCADSHRWLWQALYLSCTKIWLQQATRPCCPDRLCVILAPSSLP